MFPDNSSYVSPILFIYYNSSCFSYTGDQLVEAKADRAWNFFGDGQSYFCDRNNCWSDCECGATPYLFGYSPIRIFLMSIQPSDFSGFMIFILVLSFFTISYFMGMMVHSAFMYEDKKNIGKDSRIGWVLSMLVGTGITGWMFYYGYYINFLR